MRFRYFAGLGAALILAASAAVVVAFAITDVLQVDVSFLDIAMLACLTLFVAWPAIERLDWRVRDDSAIRLTRRETSHPNFLARFASIDRAWRQSRSRLADPGIRA